MSVDLADQIGRCDTILNAMQRDIQTLFEPAVPKIEQAMMVFFEQASQHIGQLEQTFDQVADLLDQSLQELASQIPNLQNGFSQIVTSAQQHNIVMQQQLQQVSAEQQQALDAIGQDFQQLGQTFSDIESKLFDQHTLSDEQIADWVGTIETGIDDMQTRKDQLLASLGQYSDSSNQQFQVISTQFDDLTADMQQKLDQFTHETAQAGETSLVQVKTLFDGLSADLEQSSQIITLVLGQFGEEGQQVAEIFSGKTGEVLGKAEDVLRLIEQIKPLIELAKNF